MLWYHFYLVNFLFILYSLPSIYWYFFFIYIYTSFFGCPPPPNTSLITVNIVSVIINTYEFKFSILTTWWLTHRLSCNNTICLYPFIWQTQSVTIMWQHYLTDSVSDYHVTTLPDRLSQWLSCDNTIWQTQLVTIMWQHYLTDSVSDYHVTTLPDRLSQRLSCNNTTWQTQSMTIK